MARTSDSLSELERRAETTRAELAQTVDALHSRVSPGAIKADIRSYVRDNPLQAAAIAVGAVYPLWRMIGAMPAPVLLIGAGLAATLPLTRAERDTLGEANQALRGKLGEAAEQARDLAAAAASEVKATASPG